MKTKKCTMCNIKRPLSDFYYRKDSKKYRNQCVYCLNRRKRKKLFIDFNKKLQECSKCGEIKKFGDFYLCKTSKTKVLTVCKQCRLLQTKTHRKNNIEKYKNYAKGYEQKVRKERPWDLYYDSAKQRCENKNTPSWLNYGGRGIKLLMTRDDFKFIWFRDKAYEMEKPSVHRIDNNSHYLINNCKFLEMKEHAGLTRNAFIIKQYDLNGNLIKEWSSYNKLIKCFSKAVKQSKNIFGFKWTLEKNK